MDPTQASEAMQPFLSKIITFLLTSLMRKIITALATAGAITATTAQGMDTEWVVGLSSFVALIVSWLLSKAATLLWSKYHAERRAVGNVQDISK